MSEFQHTPAPWTIREVVGNSIPGQRAFAIDFNEDQEQVVDWVYEEADAQLIAAAPELLAALTKCLSLKGTLELHGILHEVESAIAKARGES
ncbi:hypothetical protein [Pseudomonas sp. Irchel 3F6]|uniref:hypothetical protein n=1 Tax=Pseudomonas sp. Irchel 3F6 TaxID=2009003 RepID=UPI000BA34748|nr:hypothetical protein [Pseudomonas sp. Irchel 3F6]